MAQINKKNVKDLDAWDQKELRKLKIMAKNRLSSLTSHRSSSEVSEKHLLSGYDVQLLNDLILDIQRAEKKLKSE